MCECEEIIIQDNVHFDYHYINSPSGRRGLFPGSTVNLSCTEGYKFVGNKTATCLKNCTWTTPSYYCQSMCLDNIVSVANIYFSTLKVFVLKILAFYVAKAIIVFLEYNKILSDQMQVTITFEQCIAPRLAAKY